MATPVASSVPSFKVRPPFPHAQVNRNTKDLKRHIDDRHSHAIFDLACGIAQNEDAIKETQQRVLQIHETTNRLINQLREDLSKSQLPSMTKEAQDLLLKDTLFITLMTEAVKNLLKQQLDEYSSRIKLLEKRVEDLAAGKTPSRL